MQALRSIRLNSKNRHKLGTLEKTKKSEPFEQRHKRKQQAKKDEK